jgi:hypothetical protein
MQQEDTSSTFISHEMPPTKPKAIIPGAIRDELRSLVAIKCFEIVSRKGALKQAEQQSYLYKFITETMHAMFLQLLSNFWMGMALSRAYTTKRHPP